MADPVSVDNVVWRPKRGPFALGPVTSAAREGRFIALIGPNGAGKSSLLNIMCGILEPLSGGVDLFGKPLDLWNPRERGRAAAFLAQDAERPFGFPVEEYVELGRFPHVGPFGRFSAADRDAVACELKAWGLQDFAARSVRSLSGGEFQRARLARAFAQHPRLLFLDEPGNHLDLASRMIILERLAAEAEGGRCVIAVLHDVNDALLYADEAWLMDSGRLLETGSPQVVLDAPKLTDVYGLELEEFENRDGIKMLGFPRSRMIR